MPFAFRNTKSIASYVRGVVWRGEGWSIAGVSRGFHDDMLLLGAARPLTDPGSGGPGTGPGRPVFDPCPSRPPPNRMAPVWRRQRRIEARSQTE